MTTRPPPGQTLAHWRDRDRVGIARLQQQIVRWTADRAAAILASRNGMVFPAGLHDRARDAWEAPLAIGHVAGGDWAGDHGRAWRACEHVVADVEDDGGAHEMLLADVRTVFRDAGDPDALSTARVLGALHALDGRPWREWRRGQPLSSRGLSTLLKPFRVRPVTFRQPSGGTPKGYRRAHLEPVWQTYLLQDPGSQSATPQQANEIHTCAGSESATSDPCVAETNGETALQTRACCGVADTSPSIQEDRAAIMEYEGGLTRSEADAQAAHDPFIKDGARRIPRSSP